MRHRVQRVGSQPTSKGETMKKLIAPLVLVLVLVLGAAAAMPATSSALCEYETCGGEASAIEYAAAYASLDYGGTGYGEYCTGPYGKGLKKETQWACYGHNSNGVHWQVNVSAYGEQEYHNP
jgi:hypothetical protein